LEEQEKIANFLSKVDEKIAILEDKLELWNSYKKGIMQQLFSQQLRFKDENGNSYPDWEEKKLGEVVESSSSNLSINDLENNFGNYPIYGATGFIKCIDFYEKNEDYIAIVKDGASVGRNFLCSSNSSILGILNYLNSKNNYDLNFIYYLLNSINFKKYIIGSTIPHIYFKDYSKELVHFPFLEEQEKIANFLTNIDNKVDEIDKNLKIQREFKKGLLQKMFC
jgi:type I restriction enzyme S subunit